MELQLLNPFIRYSNIHKNVDQYGEIHVAYDCRFFYVVEGTVDLTINGRTQHMTQYSAVLIPPGIGYCIQTNDTPAHKAVVDFDQVSTGTNPVESLGTVTFANFDPEQCSVAPLIDVLAEPRFFDPIPEIKNDVVRMIETFLKQGPCYIEYSSAILKLILLQILQKEQYAQNAGMGLCGAIKDFITNHACEGITNADVANRFGYHSYYLNRILKKNMGTTITQMIIECKLKNAENRMITTTDSVQVIAAKAGFSDIAYFSRLFKSRYGVSPKEFRKKYLL